MVHEKDTRAVAVPCTAALHATEAANASVVPLSKNFIVNCFQRRQDVVIISGIEATRRCYISITINVAFISQLAF